jgi:dihydropteroate synthase
MLRIEDLSEILEAHRSAANARVKEFKLGDKEFRFNSQPSIMGVVNLSPDSWYRESVCLSTEAAVRRARVLTEQGADIIDLGAESTLAHAARVGKEIQDQKLRPIIGELAAAKIIVSVECYDACVARASLEAGAKVINLTGAADREFYKEIAAHEAGVIICYVQGENVREVGDFDFSRDPIETMLEYFGRQIEKATAAGVEKILIDPGLGFYYRNLQDSGKRVRHQMQMFLNTFRLRTLGFPVCHALPHAFETFGPDVRCAEPFFAVLASLGKTDLFRTHEVSRTRAVLETLKVF